MPDILATTGPIYLTVALGLATTRLGLFSKSVVNLAPAERGNGRGGVVGSGAWTIKRLDRTGQN